MENFQLLRTNVLLGGQMKMDIILDSYSDHLLATDIHITPLSNNSTYYVTPDEHLLNYSHQGNIKNFYQSTQGSFFEDCLDERLSHEYILVDDSQSGKIVYDDTTEAGNKLAKYHRYNKAFEVFCPLWLEDMLDGDRVRTLEFEINAYYSDNNSEKLLCSKLIKPSDLVKSYFDSYFRHIRLNDSLLEINFLNKTASITGLSLVSGDVTQIDIPELSYNLLYRERPMMEFDAMLINSFKNNSLIARQLFNFNILFNLDDLLSKNLSHMLYGHEIRFEINTYIDGIKLGVRDFYSNYEYINRIQSTISILNPSNNNETTNNETTNNETTNNVFDYMKDNQCVDLVTKNKYSQQIIHWSLLDNPDYIFNIYKGFGIYYQNSPDLLSTSYPEINDDNLNDLRGLNWINTYKINKDTWDKLLSVNEPIYNNIKNNNILSNILSNWINYIKYYDTELPERNWDSFDMMALLVGEQDLKSIEANLKYHTQVIDYVALSDNVYCIKLRKLDDVFVLLTDIKHANKIMFASFSKLLNEYIDKNAHIAFNSHLKYLKDKMSNVKYVPLMTISNSLYIVNANTPNPNSKEITYYKDNEAISSYVLRYDGKIKPTFLEEKTSNNLNKLYYKRYISENEYKTSAHSNYSSSGLPPRFPSINYYAIESSQMEFKKLYNKLFVYKPYITMSLIKRSEDNTNIERMIKEYLAQFYNVDINNEAGLIDTIYNKYDVQYEYDYLSSNNIDDYVYDVQLTLV